VPRLIWSPQALIDVQRLYRFLVAKDEAAARRAIKTIRAGVKVLAHQPEIGRPVDDADPEFREWLIDFGRAGYLVLYHFDGDTATLLAVRHQKESGY
jgi:plasmid stabilization system protein ParE